MSPARHDPRPLFPDGVLVVDKPAGPTSHDVVAAARRALALPRVGHTGTLDPHATGVLPLVLGRATRLAQFLTASAKEYDATIAFGRTTDTYDSAGTVLTTSAARPGEDELEAALGRFRGTFDQTPPAFSAKRVGGKRAYALARRVRSASPPAPDPVPVTVERLDLLSFDGTSARLAMRVSAGFYVRSLAHDLGRALGMGAVLEALRRTRAGDFDLSGAVGLDELVRADRAALAARVVALAALLPDLPAVVLTEPALARVRHGGEVGPRDVVVVSEPPPPLSRLVSREGRLVALARPGRLPGSLHAFVVLS
jgi:tRNA pseudouridine55 synthase